MRPIPLQSAGKSAIRRSGWSARDLADRLIQWEPLRSRARHAGHVAIGVRGKVLERSDRLPPLRNIYAATTQKAGSQWTKAIFAHEIIRSTTRLAVLPQLEYADGLLPRQFPAACFVPGLYLSYASYCEFTKPGAYRTFYISRDPRDIVVSAYYSGLESHRLMGSIMSIRKRLQGMSLHEGLMFTIQYQAPSLMNMGTWLEVNEPEVAFFRIEDLMAEPAVGLRRLLAHCEIELPPDGFERLLRETSREALREKDLRRRSPGQESHYRKTPSSHSGVLRHEHYEELRRLTGDLTERLGYQWG